MNCQQIQDLLPLYVGSELEEEESTRVVSAHLQDCETCSGAAREYRETRKLLQTFVPPTFTEEFYAQMRQSVWQKVDEKSTARHVFFNVVFDLFRPRMAWAFATAVLLIALSVLGIYVVSRRAPTAESVVSNPSSPIQSPPIPEQPGSLSQNGASTSLSASSGTKPLTASVPRKGSRHDTVHERASLAAVSQAAPVAPSPDSPSQVSDSRHLTYRSSDDSHPPLRMEIQTKNPNIRIIWLTSRDTKHLSTNSKGT